MLKSVSTMKFIYVGSRKEETPTLNTDFHCKLVRFRAKGILHKNASNTKELNFNFVSNNSSLEAILTWASLAIKYLHVPPPNLSLHPMCKHKKLGTVEYRLALN